MLGLCFADEHGLKPNRSSKKVKSDNTKALQTLMDAGEYVFFKTGRYFFSGGLIAKDGTRIEGIGSLSGFGNGTEFIFDDDDFTGPAIGSQTGPDTGEDDDGLLTRPAIGNISMDVRGAYSHAIDFEQSIGAKLRELHIKTDSLTMGGIRFARSDLSKPSWVASLLHVFVRLPDDSTGMPLEADFSDSSIIACGFTGGRCSELSGAGGVRALANRFDRANDVNLKVRYARATINSHMIVANQFEEAGRLDVEFVADDLETYQYEFATIFSLNNFRSPHAAQHVKLTRTRLAPVSGGYFGNNLPAFNPDTDASPRWMTSEMEASALGAVLMGPEPDPVPIEQPTQPIAKKKTGFFAWLFGLFG